MKRFKFSPRTALTMVFSTVVFIILFITMFILVSVVYVLSEAGLLEKIDSFNMFFPIAFFALMSILAGTIVAAIVGSIPLKPLNKLMKGMNELASGNYTTRLDLGSLSISQDLSKSFNTLASELQNTEMLRSDFINNLSHEFKTPIVSLRGFAKLLQRGDLSDKQKQEYLNIIVTESGRLADMATNILDLTKVENQNILTDVTFFNLSEQIRNCVLLLEKKWSKKGLTIVADFDEHNINANEELLKQVWINLIDNAIKFSEEDSEISISITEKIDKITVSVKNNGPEISDEDQKRIFDKFWQGDISHASEGTGIGLSISRKITELHKGKISVMSLEGETSFLVELPKQK